MVCVVEEKSGKVPKSDGSCLFEKLNGHAWRLQVGTTEKTGVWKQLPLQFRLVAACRVRCQVAPSSCSTPDSMLGIHIRDYSLALSSFLQAKFVLLARIHHTRTEERPVLFFPYSKGCH